MRKHYFVQYCCVMAIFFGSIRGSTTFFAPRSITADATFELAETKYHLLHDILSQKKENWGAALYIKPLYQKSVHGKKLAPYFLPNCKSTVLLREDGSGDVDPLWVNLIAPQGSQYSSSLKISPHRTVGGAYINVYLFDECHFPGWMLELMFAAIHVKHELRLCESNSVASGTITGVKNACDAFNQPSWNAGKISCGKLKNGGVDNIQMKLSYLTYSCDENSNYGAYLVGVIPTGHQACSQYLFAPVVGSKHGAFGFGLNGSYNFLECDGQDTDQRLDIMFDAKYLYYFSAQERRLFDVKNNGDWSRYLQVVTQARPYFSMPAVNFLEGCVKVTPRSSVDIWAALHYTWCQWEVEAGYNFWWRDSEKISCVKTALDNQQVAIFDLAKAATCQAVSASKANISQGVQGSNVAPIDLVFTPLTSDDLNLCSAAQPRSLTNKVYGSLAYNSDWCGWDTLVGLGASYEIASCSSNALEQWALWGQLGIGF